MAETNASTFALAIEALSSGRYRINVTDSPAGTASTEIDAPATFDDLAQLGDVLGGRAGLSAQQQDEAARTFGEKLFRAVFSGPIYDAYTSSLASAGDSGLNVRLTLDKAGVLADAPWELLRAPKAKAPLRVALPSAPRQPHAVGGLRESVSGPRLLIIVVLLLIVGAVIFAISRRAGGMVLIPPAIDADLTVTNLRFLPPHPSPGQVVKVAITFKNTGTTDSGAFNWAWFKLDPGQESGPDIQGRVENVSPDTTITVKGEFIPGWWGEYSTTAWVNFDAKATEKNLFNNFNKPGAGFIAANHDPFVIDFTLLPNGSSLLENKELKGDEFAAWNLSLKADSTGNTQCSTAIVKLLIQDDINRLTTGLPQKTDTCTNLPIVFLLSRPIGAASVDFIAQTAGDYSLDLLDSSGQVISTAKVTLLQPGSGTLKVPLNNRVLADTAGAMGVVFRGQGSIALQRLILNEVVAVTPS